MNVESSLTFALSHIGNLVANLAKKNLNTCVQEIKELLHIFGAEAEQHLYKAVLSQLEWTNPSSEQRSSGTPNGNCSTNSIAGLTAITITKEKETVGNGSQITLGFGGSNGALLVLLIQQIASFIPLHRFATYFALAVSSPLYSTKTVRQGWVSGICKILKLTKLQEVVICLQLLHSSSAEVRNQATSYLKLKLPELVHNYIEADSDGRELSELSTETLHLILTSSINSQRDPPISLLSSEQQAEFITALQKEFAHLQAPLILLPIIYPNSDTLKEKINIDTSTNMAKNLLEGSLSEMVLEIGYNFCNTVEECRNNLASFGIQSITPGSVAKVIGLMVRSHSGLQAEQVNTNLFQIGLQNLSDPNSLWSENKEKGGSQSSARGTSANSADGIIAGSVSAGVTASTQSWNIEIFIKVVLELVPNLNGKEVIAKLDYKGFLVKDRIGLKLLFTGIRALLQGQGIRVEHFPVDCFYKHWQNTEEQVLLLTQILNNSDIFCFADYPCHMVQTDGLKSVPELDNKEILSWKSIELLNILLWLSEIPGHYTPIKEIFKFPIQHCPDILVMGLIQVKSAFSMLRRELLMSLIPIFLGSHPNSGIILHHIWYIQDSALTVRPIMMQSMAEWYMIMENDQTRLSRVLDVAQDLKALPLLLNIQPFQFVIDLACLACRREYLKLDKWLTDKMREHGEPFITACVKFLQRRCPQLIGAKEELLPKSSQLPTETVATMMTCLQAFSLSGPQELSDAIITMFQNFNLMRNRQMSLLGFPAPGEPIAGITSNLGNLAIGGSAASSSIFQAPSTPGGMGAIGSNIAQSSPARPITSVAQVVSSQAPLSSILLPPVGTQLPSLPTSSILSAASVPSTIASQTSQPPQTVAQHRPVGYDMSRIFEVPPMISKEVEDEANSYFQRIYNHPPHPTLTIEEVLEMLKEFHESPTEHERDVYSCMLKNLFDEYRFFPTYPNRELILTATLFGGIIEQGLVEYMALGVALRYVMEALQKPHASKMYYFGIVALDRFKTRLKDYPRYCQYLAAIEHFSEFPPHLIEYINFGTRSLEPPTKPTGTVLPTSMSISPSTPGIVGAVGSINPGTASVVKTLTSTTTTTTTSAIVARPNVLAASGKPTIAAANLDTLLGATEKEEKQTPPPDHLQDKVAFIFNNLSQSNLPQKCEELKEILTEDYWPWAAQYMVMKRASLEHNFHTLYSLFLDQLNIPAIANMVLQDTLRNVKVLLRADKSGTNFSDNKSLLKNLGHWLGMLTLAKNRPVLHVDIDMKSLLLEAYKKGLQELQYVIPFVVKVMESCAKSRVFKPRNPWTMAIMNVLSELHAEQDMKLHLKFEIEVLCKALDLKLEDLKPPNILKNQEKLARLKQQLALPGGKRSESTPLSAPFHVGTTWQYKLPSQSTGLSPTDPFKPPTVNNIPLHLTGESGISTQSSSSGATPTPPSVLPSHSSTTPTQMLPQAALEPKFAYSEISQSSLRCFDAHISVSSALGESSPQLRQLVRHAIELSVQEIISAILERSVKVAMHTADHIIKKDFALEPDERNMRNATHLMVRNLAAAHAMMPCREYLASTITKNLKQAILVGFRTKTSGQQMDQIDQLAQSIGQENVGLACAFIQKTAAEKAVVEMDKRLAPEYEARKLARAEGRRYCDTRVLTYQAERMPEQIRLKVGCVPQQQMVVYQEFGRNIPGFKPKSEPEPLENQDPYISKPVPVSPAYPSDDAGTFLILTERISSELDQCIQALTGLAPSSPLIPMLHSLLEGLVLCRSNRDATAVQLLIKRSVENLFEGVRELPSDPEYNSLAIKFRDVHLIVIKAMADLRSFGAVWASKFVTKCWTEVREEVRFNIDVVDWLLRASLINISMIDEHLARSIEEIRMTAPYSALGFAMQLVQNYLVDERSNGIITEPDIPLTLESLIRFCQTRQAPEQLVNIIDALRMKHDLLINDRINSGNTGNSIASSIPSALTRVVGNVQSSSSHHFHSGVNQARDFNDPQGLHNKTDMLLRHWIQAYHSPTAGQGSQDAFSEFVKEMDRCGILKTDDVITRFFRICITMCRDLCIRTILESGTTSNPTEVRNKCFPNLDAFVRLIALLVKQSGEPSNPTAKINLLNKVLGLICGIMLHDIETNGTEFQQLPYHRILIMLFLELNAPEKVLESINAPVLMAFTQTLHLLRPSKCSGFAYAWLEMVSHRVFIGRMLAITPQQKGWSMYSMLLTDLFKYLAPFLRNVELSKPLLMLYKGTLRVLLVLLHDFPEFLCEYHYTFCDDIPPNCIQMRNLILSAYPRNMRLPDPFMPTFKVDRLPEIASSPKIHVNVASLIQPVELKKNLDSYLKNRTPVTFLSELRSYLQMSEPGNKYNMNVMNALVLYVGMQAITQIQNKSLTPSMATIAHSAHMDIFENLAVDLDTEGRYLFLIAIANQLRYPNSHTHYFSCTLLYLFSEANTEAIQEQITRVLLERLIANRPQPWGLLITFIELIKNPSFKFWSHEFVKCAPEIEKIFESVAKSCTLPKQTGTE